MNVSAAVELHCADSFVTPAVDFNTINNHGRFAANLSLPPKINHAYVFVLFNRIKTHRLVLCPANNYFASLFTSEMQEKDKPEISLKDIAGPILKDLIEYCYTDQIAINQENVYDLMAGASMYQFTRLADEFEKYFRKNIRAQNCLGLWGSARQHAYEVLDELAFDFICEHFTEVLNTDEFLVLGIELLVELLSDDKLEVSSEEDVFNSIKNWLKFDVLGRKMFSESLIETVRMTKISDKVQFAINKD